MKSNKTQKIGHCKIDPEGNKTFKNKSADDIKEALQIGIKMLHSIVVKNPTEKFIITDFRHHHSHHFPKCGSETTPSHNLFDFEFRSYAPRVFEYFRRCFQIENDEYLTSLCGDELLELSNPGASGSLFYLTPDDRFIIKTVSEKEGNFLLQILKEYYINLSQNPNTFLPKYIGYYTLKGLRKTIRIVVMNNLLPSICIDEKYDLKGSTFNRFANEKELEKSIPTLKDQDFRSLHEDGLTLDPSDYDEIIRILKADCLSLKTHSIMDYSLLLGIQKMPSIDETQNPPHLERRKTITSFRNRKPNKINLFRTVHSSVTPKSFQAMTSCGEIVCVYIGIIDILQSYSIIKKLEHQYKSILYDGDTISVCDPRFYKMRFINFISNQVFKRGPENLWNLKFEETKLMEEAMVVTQNDSVKETQ